MISRVSCIVGSNPVYGCPTAALVHEVGEVHVVYFQRTVQISGVIIGHGLHRAYHDNFIRILVDGELGIAGIIPRLVVNSQQAALNDSHRSADGIAIHVAEVSFRPCYPCAADVTDGVSQQYLPFLVKRYYGPTPHDFPPPTISCSPSSDHVFLTICFGYFTQLSASKLLLNATPISL